MYSQREALAARFESSEGLVRAREFLGMPGPPYAEYVAAFWLRFALNKLKLHRDWMRHAIEVGRMSDEDLEEWERQWVANSSLQCP